jgi:hypothetical protein
MNKCVLSIVLVINSSFLLAQTKLLNGTILHGSPMREWVHDDTLHWHEAITVNNFAISGTKFLLHGLGPSLLSTYHDTLWASLPGQPVIAHYYNHAAVRGTMVFASGMSHRTVLPARPITMCAGGSVAFINPDGWSVMTEGLPIGWFYTPEGITYTETNLKLVGTALRDHWMGTELFGVYNKSIAGEALEIHRMLGEYPDNSFKIMELPIASAFYINETRLLGNKLVVTGFRAASNQRKVPKVVMVDLISLESEVYDFDEEPMHHEAVSTLLLANGTPLTIVRETDLVGNDIGTRAMFLGQTGGELTSWSGTALVPNFLLEQNSGRVLLGGHAANGNGGKDAVLCHLRLDDGILTEIGRLEGLGASLSMLGIAPSDTGLLVYGSRTASDGLGSSFLHWLTELPAPSGITEVERNHFTLESGLLRSVNGGLFRWAIYDSVGRRTADGLAEGHVQLDGLSAGMHIIVAEQDGRGNRFKLVSSGSQHRH